jgi:hypothetical protein
MRKQILTYDETKRNARVKELMSNKKNNLLVSGTTGQLDSWNVDEVLRNNTIGNAVEQLLQFEYDNTIGKYTEGMTYLEVEQFNNSYNNFR